MAKYCHNCGNPITTQGKFCQNCGAPLVVSAAQSAEAPKEEPSYNQPVSTMPSNTSDQACSPILLNWKTNVGASIAGAVAFCLASFMFAGLDLIPGGGFIVIPLALVWTAVELWYACLFYPALFREDCPYTVSPAIISFMNLFIGCIIFGCIWNSNLTNKVKGISYIVFAVIDCIGTLAYFFL